MSKNKKEEIPKILVVAVEMVGIELVAGPAQDPAELMALAQIPLTIVR